MLSVLAVAYDTSTGVWFFQKLGANQLSPGAITSGIMASGSIGALNQIADGLFAANAEARGKFANGFLVSSLVAGGAIGTGHMANDAIVSGKLGSGAIPDSSVSEAQLVSGISIDIAESLSEPTTLAAEPISGHACVMFLSGFAGKRVGVAFANNPNKMPAVGKIGGTNIASGAAMTTNPILAYGRQPSPILSGNVGKLVYVGTNGQPTVTAPSASGNAVQAIGQVMDNDGTLFLVPQPFFIQVAA